MPSVGTGAVKKMRSALGGDCVEDMKHFISDEGLAAETARQWLDGFHHDGLMSTGLFQKALPFAVVWISSGTAFFAGDPPMTISRAMRHFLLMV